MNSPFLSVLVIGSKRVHSYSLVSPALSEAGTGTSNSSTDLDACDNFNWTTFGSDPIQMESLSDGTLSTFIHEVSIHTGSHHSRNTQATWLDAVRRNTFTFNLLQQALCRRLNLCLNVLLFLHFMICVARVVWPRLISANFNVTSLPSMNSSGLDL